MDFDFSWQKYQDSEILGRPYVQLRLDIFTSLTAPSVIQSAALDRVHKRFLASSPRSWSLCSSTRNREPQAEVVRHGSIPVATQGLIATTVSPPQLAMQLVR